MLTATEREQLESIEQRLADAAASGPIVLMPSEAALILRDMQETRAEAARRTIELVSERTQP